MEENKTLEELNQEYVNLAGRVSGYRQTLESLITEKDKISADLERAMQLAENTRMTYEAQLKIVESAEEAGFTEDSINQLKEQVDNARKDMEAAEALVENQSKKEAEEIERITELQLQLEEADGRMNLILVSFGANETIKNALVNELELDYGEKIEEKEEKQNDLDALKTSISNDPRIQGSVNELARLLEEFEATKAVTTPENVKKLTEISSKIKATRTSISKRMRTLGLKGGKVTAEEIDAMTTEKDAQGRYVIAEIDRQVQALDLEIGAIAGERDSIIESMEITAQMAKSVTGTTPEYEQVSQELKEVTEEIKEAQNQKENSEKRLSEIPDERTVLQAELNGLMNSNPNAAQIVKLQAELDAINAEVIDSVVNPRIAEINDEIARLEREGANGSASIETQEYIDAKKEVEEAENAIVRENENPSVDPGSSNYVAGDIIIDNPERGTAYSEYRTARNELENFDNANPHVKATQEAVKKAEEEYGEAKKEYGEAKADLDDMNKKLDEKYITNESFPGLDDPDSAVSKAFTDYKNKELDVRKAMLAMQKEPTDENKAAYKKAIQDFQAAEQKFSGELAWVNENGVKPTSEAIHNFLMQRLDEEFANAKNEDIPEEYNLKAFSNRLAILKKSVDELGDTEEVRKTSDALAELMSKVFAGEKVDDDDLDKAIEEHNATLEVLLEGAGDGAKEKFLGNGLPEPAKKGFLSKLFGRFGKPKQEYVYPFDEDVKGLTAEETEQLKELKDKADIAKETMDEKDDALKTAKQKEKDEITQEDKDRRTVLEGAIKTAERKYNDLPEKINQSAKERLESLLTGAREKLARTPQYKATTDTEQQIEALKRELADAEAEVPDPAKVSDREARANAKQKEIDNLGAGIDTAKVAELQGKIALLDEEEIDQQRKLSEAEATIATKTPRFQQLSKRFKMLEAAKAKIAGIKNLIQIKNARKMSDRRSNVAGDLANAAKKPRTNDEDLDR